MGKQEGDGEKKVDREMWWKQEWKDQKDVTKKIREPKSKQLHILFILPEPTVETKSPAGCEIKKKTKKWLSRKRKYVIET